MTQPMVILDHKNGTIRTAGGDPTRDDALAALLREQKETRAEASAQLLSVTAKR